MRVVAAVAALCLGLVIAGIIKPVEAVCESRLHELPRVLGRRVVGNQDFITTLSTISFAGRNAAVFNPHPEEL